MLQLAQPQQQQQREQSSQLQQSQQPQKQSQGKQLQYPARPSSAPSSAASTAFRFSDISGLSDLAIEQNLLVSPTILADSISQAWQMLNTPPVNSSDLYLLFE